MNPELPSSGWFARSPTTPIALRDRRPLRSPCTIADYPFCSSNCQTSASLRLRHWATWVRNWGDGWDDLCNFKLLRKQFWVFGFELVEEFAVLGIIAGQRGFGTIGPIEVVFSLV
jgi:hypothetical protein